MAWYVVVAIIVQEMEKIETSVIIIMVNLTCIWYFRFFLRQQQCLLLLAVVPLAGAAVLPLQYGKAVTL